MEATKEFVTIDYGALTYQVFKDRREKNNERPIFGMPPIFDSSISSLIPEKIPASSKNMHYI